MNISNELKKMIEEFIESLKKNDNLLKLANDGKVTIDIVEEYLASVLYLISNTPVHLKLAQEYSSHLPKLKSHFEKKIQEETGHDKWAEADLSELDKLSKLSQITPNKNIVDLVKYLEHSIRVDVKSYLAYILFAEYFTVLAGPLWVGALVNHCNIPVSALSVVTNHMELDKEHVADGSDEIDDLLNQDNDFSELVTVVYNSQMFFKLFFNDLASKVK